MAHPHHEHRQHKVEHSRVHHITRGYASGGGVHEDGAITASPSVGKKAYAERDAQAVEGKSAKERMDRPGRRSGGPIMRAKGGRTKSKGTHVNVIVAPQGGHTQPMAPGVMPAAAPSPPMAPPPRPMPPQAPPMAGAGPMPPPGMMPPRRSGGRAYASGGAVKDGPAYKEGIRSGTPVQHNPSGKNDQKDVNRPRPITYKTGGAVEAPKAAKPIGPHMPGGGGGAKARLAKMRLAKRDPHGMAP